MISPDERRLVDLARAGDQDAFAELWKESLPQIRAVARETSRCEADIEDFLSGLWLGALQYLRTFRGDCKFSTWIVSIARHKALAIQQRREQPKYF